MSFGSPIMSYLSCVIEDGEYEVTAEMLIHEDVDDERTLDEEEAFQDQVEVMEELSNLEKVGSFVTHWHR